MPKLAIFLFFVLGLHAEVHSLTLRQAVELALKDNPDILLARLDERKAVETIRIVKDPFTPRITVGSGLAYSSGFPMSIEGAAPSIVQARASQYIYNRQQSYLVAQAKEDARGAGIATAGKRDEVIFQVASLFLDAERAARVSEMAGKEVESRQKVARTVQSLLQEGRALPLEVKQAAYLLARARQAVESMEGEQEAAETSLAVVLGFPADDRVRPMAQERTAPPPPASEEAAIESAMQFSKELRRLESQIVAKGLEIRSEKASRLPRIDLVAQYGLFAKFNHYEDFFRKFERHNGQLGVSFQLPLLTGPGVSAQTAQTEAEIERLRAEMKRVRNRIMQDLRQAYRDIRKAATASEVARLDLEVAREQLSVNLALMQEGRASLRQVEESRIVESDKWVGFYDAQYAAERARWNLLRQTGDLLAALR